MSKICCVLISDVVISITFWLFRLGDLAGFIGVTSSVGGLLDQQLWRPDISFGYRLIQLGDIVSTASELSCAARNIF